MYATDYFKTNSYCRVFGNYYEDVAEAKVVTKAIKNEGIVF